MSDNQNAADILVFAQRELPFYTKEEIKVLRTNLLFSGDDKRVICITSCMANEGKSTVSLELARSLADLGKSVMLIDADLRNSVFKEKLEGGRARRGLSHYLTGQSSMQDIIYQTNIDNLSFISCGVIPPNPSELLSGALFDKLLKVCAGVVDYVIVDCPPLGVVIDAAVVAPKCDGSILILEAHRIKHRMAQDVVAKLHASDKPILGVVLNKVDPRHGRNYGEYYSRYGKYGYGYGRKRKRSVDDYYGYGAYGAYGYGKQSENEKKK